VGIGGERTGSPNPAKNSGSTSEYMKVHIFELRIMINHDFNSGSLGADDGLVGRQTQATIVWGL